MTLCFLFISMALVSAYHESQKYELCGKHALNNMFQKEAHTEYSLNRVCKDFVQETEESLKQQFHLTDEEVKSFMEENKVCSERGDYDIQVLARAIQGTHKIWPPVNEDSTMGLKIAQLVEKMCTKLDTFIGILVHNKESSHWTSLRKDKNGKWFHHDSAKKSIDYFDNETMLHEYIAAEFSKDKYQGFAVLEQRRK